jgi:hypothetical protein
MSTTLRLITGEVDLFSWERWTAGLTLARTFYFYFWTSFTPYTVKTVTSTLTTTTTVLSVYVTDSADASSSFSSSISSFTASPPYSATSLKSSTSPVPLNTGASAPTSGSTSSNQGGNRAGGANAASVIAADIKVLLTGAALAAVVGGLALGL